MIDNESLEEQVYVTWSARPKKSIKAPVAVTNQMSLFEQDETISFPDNTTSTLTEMDMPQNEIHPQQDPTFMVPLVKQSSPFAASDLPTQSGDQVQLNIGEIDREAIIKFINEQGFLTYLVRNVKIHNYLKSLLDLAGLLTQSNIFAGANDEVEKEVVEMIHEYIEKLHRSGKYDKLAEQVLSLKLSIRIFDVFGVSLDNGYAQNYFTASESGLDRQLRAADAKLGAYGFPYKYGRMYGNLNNPSEYKIDCILFAADDECISKLNIYAEEKFHNLNDQYRKYVVNKSERCKKQYSDIIADGDIVSKHNFTLPERINAKIEVGGKEYTDHLFADDNGISKIKLNGWEEGVLEEESKSKDFVCWLRNPPKGSWSLCIPYEINGEIKSAYPDFIVIRSDPTLSYIIDILEPHNPDYKDNLSKAKGFAKYAEEEPRIGRIQLIRKGKDSAGNIRFKRLDLSKGAVREKVMKAQTVDEFDHIFETDGYFGC